ncbi:unnamed protein product, partial [Effrenium voratum]
HVPGEHERNSFETMLLSTYICTCVCTYLEVQQCINIRTPRLPPHFFSSPSPTACSGACQAVRKALLQEPPCAIDMPRVNAQGRAAAPANLVSEESCGMRALVTPQTMFFGQGGVQASPDSDQGGLMPCSILGVHRIEAIARH